MQNSIIWPEGYLPGTTDNFCSNEVIVSGLKTSDIWPLLANPFEWPKYYHNSSELTDLSKCGQQRKKEQKSSLGSDAVPDGASALSNVVMIGNWQGGDVN